MTDVTDYTDEFLSDPTAIQAKILREYEGRLDGQGMVVDGNNTFMFVLEAFSQLSSSMVNKVDEKLRQVYSRRALSTKDLYNHISDFDYVGFYSTPATLPMRMMLHKDYVLENAIPVPGTNYNKIVIPKETTFELGNYTFGLHYPIEIRVNPIVQSISAVYDTSESNPLNSLNNNTIGMEEVITSGITLISFEFPTYQFNNEVFVEAVNPNMGFNKTYKFDDRFYAMRVWDDISGEELAITMSDEVYDPLLPTVVMRIYPEDNAVSISIPQIYFNNGMVGSRLKVAMLSTLGEVDINFSTLKLEDIKANFSLDTLSDTSYTSVLRNIPTIIIAPTIQRVQGGSNGFTFQEIKDRVVYRRGSSTAPITNLDLDNYFTENGFRAYKKVDNLTDRRYYAFKALGLDDIAVANGTLTLRPDDLSQSSSVTQPTTERLVVLPGMVYKFHQVGNRFIPLSDNEIDNFSILGKQELANELNTNQYLVNPYHIVLNMKNRYPNVSLYDLLDISTDNIGFIQENVNLSAQLNVVSAQISHEANGSGSYRLRLGIAKTKEFDDIPTSDVGIYMSFETVTGSKVGVAGTYVSEYETLSVYDFILQTDYNLVGDTIEVQNLVNNGGGTLSNILPLASKFFITTMVKKSHFLNVPQAMQILPYFVESDGTWLMVSLQSIDYKLGVSLDDVLDVNLLVNWQPERFATYDMEELTYYEHDVYETDANGNIVYTIDVNGAVITNKLHDIGDPVLDASGNPIVKHYIGDTVLDASGNPIVEAARVTEYTIDLSGYDYRNVVVNSDFYNQLSTDLKSNYPVIREMDENILENTRVYFKPITSMGSALYKLNNSAVMQDTLGLSIAFKVFVTQATFEDSTLINNIATKIEQLVKKGISDKLISLTNITTEILDELSDYLHSLDIISINDNTEVQTLVNVDIDKVPRLARRLVLDDAGDLIFESAIDIDYQIMDL